MDRIKAAKIAFGGQDRRSIKQRTAHHDLIEPRQLSTSLLDRTISATEDRANDFDTGERTRHELV
jgi:hypothetical protein